MRMAFFAKIVREVVEWVEDHTDCLHLDHLLNKVHGSAAVPEGTEYIQIPDHAGPTLVQAMAATQVTERPTKDQLLGAVNSIPAPAAPAAGTASSAQSTNVSATDTGAPAAQKTEEGSVQSTNVSATDTGTPAAQKT
jgi:hypothetical protein